MHGSDISCCNSQRHVSDENFYSGNAALPARACADRWRATKANDQGDTPMRFRQYDETGIFTLVCRHAMVLAYTDMVKSGER